MVPKGWVCSSVGDACNIKNNVRLPLSSDQRKNIKGQYPYYGPTGVLDYINEYRIDEEFCLIGEDGDHFLKFKEKEMTLLINGKANVNNHAHIICASAKCIPSWFHYSFIHRDITSFLTRQGAKRYKLTKASLESLPILLPPLSEQRKIAQILSTWDKAIATTERLLANKQQQKKALMQSLLTGKQRFAGFEGEWQIVKLGSVAEMNSGGTPKSTIEDYYGGQIPWVSIADMTSKGKWIDSTVKYLTQLGLDNSSARIYPVNTVLYAMYASIGECSIAKVELASSQAILGIRPSAQLHFEFLYFYLCSLKDKIKLQGQQGTQANLNAGMVKEFLIPLPSINEQRQIASVLCLADNELTIIQLQLENLKQQKKALMQQLLTGKRRVKVDEAAA